MDRKEHWEEVYTKKPADSVSWFQEHADLSLRMISSTGLGHDAAIIDVGGGASTLVDDLLRDGRTDVTVLDLSAASLEVAKHRLSELSEKANWIEGDVTRTEFCRHRYDIWHDRAVFHFLTDPKDRKAYVDQVMRAVKPGGHVIVATFASDGPEKCSGLPVMRYDADSLHSEFGEALFLASHEKESHHTPAGMTQQFVYCYCRKSNG